MGNKWGFLALILLIPVFLNSAFLQLPSSAIIAANADISIFDYSAATIFFNPACFATAPSVSASYHSPFSLKNLGYQNIALGYKIKYFRIAVGFQQFGNDFYKESTAIISSNYPVFKSITAGFSYRFLQKNVTEFSNESAHQLDVGIKVELKKFTLSSSFLNISFSKLGKELLPQECRNSVSYTPYDNLQIAISMVKELGYPFYLNFAASYKPLKFLRLSSGFQTEPNTLSGGIGINIYKATFSYAVRIHEILPETHYLTLQYP